MRIFDKNGEELKVGDMVHDYNINQTGYITQIIPEHTFPIKVTYLGSATNDSYVGDHNGKCSRLTFVSRNEESAFEFQIGDEVNVLGLKGKVVCIYGDEVIGKFMTVDLSNGTAKSYTSKGYLPEGGYPEPIVQLVNRPKKKVKKIIERYTILLADGSTYYRIYNSEKELKDQTNHEGLILKLTGEVEVEE